MKAKFKLGRVITSRKAMARLDLLDILKGIERHQTGDWGHGDRLTNNRALVQGARLWSVYRTKAGITFWLITEADRSATTILFPEEY